MKAAPLVLGSVLLIASPAPLAAQGTVALAGEVVDTDGRLLSTVEITVDEVGLLSGTDGTGHFRLTLPRRLAAGGVRLRFEATGYFPYELDVPHLPSLPLKVELVSLHTNTTLPALPARYSSQLGRYRAAEIGRVSGFLADNERRLLVVDSLPGQGAADLVAAALGRGAGKRPPVFWWGCAASDEASLLAGELGKAIRNRHLAELALAARRTADEPVRRRLDQIASREILSSLERSPRLLVFQHVERWLGKDTHRIADPELAAWLVQLVTRGTKAKVIFVADEAPALPADLPAAWVSTLIVDGLPPAAASTYLKSVLGVELPEGSRRAIAARYDGNPFALQLVATLLAGLDARGRESEVRQLLATREGLHGAALRELFDSTYARLAADEARTLDLLALARQPLTVADLQRIDHLAGPDAHHGRVSAGALEALRTRLHLAGVTFSGSPAVARYHALELVRDYVGERLAADETRRRQLHGALFRWYRGRLPPLRSVLVGELSEAEVQMYEELAHHAFAFAELAEGPPREEAAVTGARAVLAVRSEHAVAHALRLLTAQFECGLGLLAGATARDARQVYARFALGLADILKDSPDHDDADRWFREAEAIFRDLGDRVGQADLEFSRAMQLVHGERFAEAEQALRSALKSYEAIPQDQGMANILSQLGEIELRLDRPEDARRDLELSVQHFEKAGDRHGHAIVVMHLGEIEQNMEHFAEAYDLFAQAEKTARQLPGSSWLWANTLTGLADIEGMQMKTAQADDKYRKALEVFQEVEDEAGEANARFGLAYDRAARGEYPGALDDMRRVKERYQALDQRIGLIRSGLTLASELNDLSKALNDPSKRSEAASEFLAALQVAGRSEIQLKEVVKLGAALRRDTDTALFDHEVDRQLQGMTADDRRLVEPLLERIRSVQPGK